MEMKESIVPMYAVVLIAFSCVYFSFDPILQTLAGVMGFRLLNMSGIYFSKKYKI